MSESMDMDAGWGDVVTVVMDRYDHLPKLRKLRIEADRLRELLVATGFTPAGADLAADGTARKVIDAFRDWQPDVRRLIVYWGGHGKAVRDREYYLYCRDTGGRTEPNRHTAMSATELGEQLAELGVPEVVLLVDACGAGGGGDEITAAFKAVVSRRAYTRFRPSLSVISSTSFLTKATEPAFSAAVAGVLRDGAPPDESYLPWTDRDSHISPAQLAMAVRVVLERDRANLQVPDHSMTGMIDRFFPNPRYRANVPDIELAAGHRAALGRPLLPQDVTDHFMVKFRGIDSADDQGWYFTGRYRVLRHAVGWLARGAGMLVVTGGPGCGKSALLGRLAVLSVAEYRDEVARQGGLVGVPADTVPVLGALDAGIHAKHKSLVDCVAELAAALAIPAPPAGWQGPAELLLQIARRKRATTVLFDALDEAQPAEIQSLATNLLRPLAELPGTRVLIGTRPVGAGHALLDALGAGADQTIWLDREEDRSADIEDYVRQRLVSRPGSPYAGRADQIAFAAAKIAEHSAGVFLFARLLTGLLARGDEVLDLTGPEGAALLAGGISDAFAADLRRLGPDEQAVRALLAPLAWAEGLGLPGRDVWLAVANGLAVAARTGKVYTDADLAWLINRAGDHIVASSEAAQTVYRLYHQSYNDFFHTQLATAGLGDETVHAVITKALVELIERDGVRHWRSANPYLLGHLPAHAARGGWLARLCADLDFLVNVDPVRLQRVLGTLDHRRMVLVRLFWRALAELPGTTPEERLDILGAVALREEPAAIPLLASSLRTAWSPLWSFGGATVLHRPLGGHRMAALAVEYGHAGERTMLVSGGSDHAVQAWDPVTGERWGTFIGHRAPLLAVAVTTVAGRGTVVSGDALGVLHLWDTATGQCVGTLHTRHGAVLSLAVVGGPDGEPLLCAGEDGSVIRVWRMRDRALVTELADHYTSIRSLAVLEEPGATPVLLSGGDDGRVGLWDTHTWRLTQMIDTTGYPFAIAAARVRGQLVVAIGGLWGTLQLWALRERRFLRALRGHSGALSSLAFGTIDEQTVLAAASEDGSVFIWDPATGQRLHVIRSSPPIQHTRMEALQRQRFELGPAGGAIATKDDQDQAERAPRPLSRSIYAVRFAEVNGPPELVTGGGDGAIRLWDVHSAGTTAGDPEVAVLSLATGVVGDNPVVVAGHRNGVVSIRNAETGAVLRRRFYPGFGSVQSVLLGRILGRTCVVAGGENGVLQCWDAQTLDDIGLTFRNPDQPVYAACFLRTAASTYLAHTVGTTIQLTSTATGKTRPISAGTIAPAYLSTMPTRDEGDFLVVGFLNGEVNVLRANGDVVARLSQWHISAAPLGFSMLGRWMLALAGYDNMVGVSYLEPPDYEPAAVDAAGPSLGTRIHALTYGEALGGVVAAGGANGSVTLTDPLAGEHRMDLPSHFGAIRALAFGTVDGAPILISAGDEGIQAIRFNQ